VREGNTFVRKVARYELLYVAPVTFEAPLMPEVSHHVCHLYATLYISSYFFFLLNLNTIPARGLSHPPHLSFGPQVRLVVSPSPQFKQYGFPSSPSTNLKFYLLLGVLFYLYRRTNRYLLSCGKGSFAASTLEAFWVPFLIYYEGCEYLFFPPFGVPNASTGFTSIGLLQAPQGP
jgi:hypothetical protein